MIPPAGKDLTDRMVRRPTNAAFTLTELLLVVVLLALFGGAAVMSLTPLWQNAPLEEGVGRFEGLLRFARAEAAQHGRRVRLTVNSIPTTTRTGTRETRSVQVQWEPEPLRQPGVFVENEASTAFAGSLEELIRIESVRCTEPAAAPCAEPSEPASIATIPQPESPSAEAPAVTPTEAWPPITFYPDGSSDSAEIVLSVAESSDSTDSRRMLVHWNGLSGTAIHETTHSESIPGSQGEVSNTAQPLEPSSVARSSMGPNTP